MYYLYHAAIARSTPWFAWPGNAGLGTPSIDRTQRAARASTVGHAVDQEEKFFASVMFRHASRLAVLALLPSGVECIIQAAILLFLALGHPRRQRVVSYSSIGIGCGSPDLPSGITLPASNQWERARAWRALSCWSLTPLEGFLEPEGIGQARIQAPVHAGQRVSVSAVQPRTAAKPKESTPVMSGSVLSLVCRPGQAWSRTGSWDLVPAFLDQPPSPWLAEEHLQATAFCLRPWRLMLASDTEYYPHWRMKGQRAASQVYGTD
ncbi:hypothetical protein QBC36DRAFT_375504 [Triangularia setosa]|uniref:Uncharacterized protein n=1 Tax=Triangularia setosa TaxID=2587417 RepID=A0AAN7ABD7_9PEZI|nr:hypothetical protein QBC36DRAFT_375504 [Podospora setosa]